MILREVPGAQVDGKVGRRSSFEVTINNKLVFSKLENGNFPSFEKIVEESVKASKNVETEQVTEVQKSSCCIQ
jgi:selenoprotein W-related protein